MPISVPLIKNPRGEKTGIPEILAKNNLRQLRIAETEKYAHVTFFFNGGVEKPNPGEDRILIPSSKVATYNLKPEMSAYEVCEKVLEAEDDEQYGFILVNFANPDMVGHTGVLEAAKKACSVVDECVGKVAQKAKENGIVMLLTSDHGNAEYKIYEKTGEERPSHSLNPVIFILISDKYKKAKLKAKGGLQDIAPTILDIMKMKKPKEMTGKSLIIKK